MHTLLRAWRTPTETTYPTLATEREQKGNTIIRRYLRHLSSARCDVMFDPSRRIGAWAAPFCHVSVDNWRRDSEAKARAMRRVRFADDRHSPEEYVHRGCHRVRFRYHGVRARKSATNRAGSPRPRSHRGEARRGLPPVDDDPAAPSPAPGLEAAQPELALRDPSCLRGKGPGRVACRLRVSASPTRRVLGSSMSSSRRSGGENRNSSPRRKWRGALASSPRRCNGPANGVRSSSG
jgi:hypothetical protein